MKHKLINSQGKVVAEFDSYADLVRYQAKQRRSKKLIQLAREIEAQQAEMWWQKI